jgi:hypothetical protein
MSWNIVHMKGCICGGIEESCFNTMQLSKGMYNSESMEWSSKHKRQLKSLHSTMENLLNQFHNKCSQDTICMKSCEESVTCIFFTYRLETAPGLGLYMP